jgi:hypothetical protein
MSDRATVTGIFVGNDGGIGASPFARSGCQCPRYNIKYWLRASNKKEVGQCFVN